MTVHLDKLFPCQVHLQGMRLLRNAGYRPCEVNHSISSQLAAGTAYVHEAGHKSYCCSRCESGESSLIDSLPHCGRGLPLFYEARCVPSLNLCRCLSVRRPPWRKSGMGALRVL